MILRGQELQVSLPIIMANSLIKSKNVKELLAAATRVFKPITVVFWIDFLFDIFAYAAAPD